jgi:hypothetical protein
MEPVQGSQLFVKLEKKCRIRESNLEVELRNWNERISLKEALRV